MRELKITGYLCGMVLVIGGFGLYSYAESELPAAFNKSSVVFFSLAVVALCALILCWASVLLPIRPRPLSRNALTLPPHLIAEHARS
jgi:hypothetical protein